MGRLLTEDTAIGSMGSVCVTGGAAKGDFYAVQFITATTPISLDVKDGQGTYSGFEYPAGTVIYGHITDIRVPAAKTFIAYKREK